MAGTLPSYRTMTKPHSELGTVLSDRLFSIHSPKCGRGKGTNEIQTVFAAIRNRLTSIEGVHSKSTASSALAGCRSKISQRCAGQLLAAGRTANRAGIQEIWSLTDSPKTLSVSDWGYLSN